MEQEDYILIDGTWWPKTIEQKDPDEQTKKRVEAAEKFFEKHFTIKGLPKTSKAVRLFQKYLFVTYYNLNQIEWRVRKEIRHEKILL